MSTSHPQNYFDVIILGAGGAGMMCAIHAGRRGRRVLILDHAAKLGGKILISGGGRCNFTNLGASPKNYVSENPHFCKSALSRYEPSDFIQMVEAHGIRYHEKKLGQQFCDHSAQEIVTMLKSECDDVAVEIKLSTKILKIQKINSENNSTKQSNDVRFQITASTREAPAITYSCESLVVATGGLSIPKIGATGFGYEIAKQFGLNVLPTRAALDGFTLNSNDAKIWGDLSGLSFDSIITCKSGQKNEIAFRENTLITHAGLSGPATLQASLHWDAGEHIHINLLPSFTDKGTTLFDYLLQKKKAGNTSLVKNLLSEFLPARFAERLCEVYYPSARPLTQCSDKELAEFSARLHSFALIPSGTVGYSKAEVTRGGVNTDELSSKTLEAKKVPGLYFIGEVVDVTG